MNRLGEFRSSARRARGLPVPHTPPDIVRASSSLDEEARPPKRWAVADRRPLFFPPVSPRLARARDRRSITRCVRLVRGGTRARDEGRRAGKKAGDGRRPPTVLGVELLRRARTTREGWTRRGRGADARVRTRVEWSRARGRNGGARVGAREENHQTREALDAEWTRADGEHFESTRKT